MNYHLPKLSFFTDPFCAGVSNKHCLLTFFIVPEANLIALLTFVARIHFAKFYFPLKYLTGAHILFIKLELYCALASKKKSIPDWHFYITRTETKWTNWYAMTSHVIAYRLTELLFGTHTFIFNCLLMTFIAYLRKYAAYLGCCSTFIASVQSRQSLGCSHAHNLGT